MDLRIPVWAALGAALTTAGASAQVYNDGRGNEWLQLPATVNVSWDQVAAACPTGGAAPCTGTLNGRDLSGWTWATREQVRALFATMEPRILDTPTLAGPKYLLSALTFLGGGYLTPTFSYYTTFGGYLYAAGWMAELNDDGTGAIAAVSAQYPVFDALWTVEGANDPAVRLQFAGAWLWRRIAVECAADFNGNGFVDSQDFFDFVGAFFANAPAADFNADTFINSQDLFDFLGAFFDGC